LGSIVFEKHLNTSTDVAQSLTNRDFAMDEMFAKHFTGFNPFVQGRLRVV
jgi:hypothetical protein